MTAGQQHVETALAVLLSSLAVTTPVWIWAAATGRVMWLVIPGTAAWIIFMLLVGDLWLGR